MFGFELIFVSLEILSIRIYMISFGEYSSDSNIGKYVGRYNNDSEK